MNLTRNEARGILSLISTKLLLHQMSTEGVVLYAELRKVADAPEIVAEAFEVYITMLGAHSKVATIKALRDVAGMGLADAKDVLERANPLMVPGTFGPFATVSRDEADTLVKRYTNYADGAVQLVMKAVE